MSTLRNAVRTWWSLAIVASAIAIAAIAPSTASADILGYNPGYGYGTGAVCVYQGCANTGYTNYNPYGTGYYGNYGYGTGQIAPTNYRGYATIVPSGQLVLGYRWTGYGWQRFQLAQGRYYVTPYSGKWRWVQTGYGWLIVGNATMVIG